jgi:hypothetical protein
MATVTSNLMTSNLENALLVLRFGPKSPPAVLPAKSIAWQMTIDQPRTMVSTHFLYQLSQNYPALAVAAIAAAPGRLQWS